MLTCRKCGLEFENRSLLDKHKIKDHGYTNESLGFLTAGWNKGIPYSTKGNRSPKIHLKELLSNKEMQDRIHYHRLRHEEKVHEKTQLLREKGYRVFETSNYSHHARIPDLIAISPEGKIIAVEVESLRPYKPSLETIRKRYTEALMSEKFFDEVIIEPFGDE